jgi:hypothetical protein
MLPQIFNPFFDWSLIMATVTSEKKVLSKGNVVAVFKAWQASESAEDAAQKLGLPTDKKSVTKLSTFVSQMRQPEYEMVIERDKDDNIVYRLEEDKSFKTDANGNKVPNKIVKNDEEGNPIVRRLGIPFKDMPRGRRTGVDYQEVYAELAEALGMTVEDYLAQQEAAAQA